MSRRKNARVTKALFEAVLVAIVFLCIVLVRIFTTGFRLIYYVIIYLKSDYKLKSGNGLIKVLCDKGVNGEFLLYRKVAKRLGRENVLTNIYLPSTTIDTTEIDVLGVSDNSIYCFEMKNYSGHIYGSSNDITWTQVFNRRKKYKFYNPVSQNTGHCLALKECLNIDDSYITPAVVFSNSADISNVSCASRIYKLNEVSRFIKNEEKKNNFKVTNKDEIINKLATYSLADDQLKNTHVEQIQSKYYTEDGKSSNSYLSEILKNVFCLIAMILILVGIVICCSQSNTQSAATNKAASTSINMTYIVKCNNQEYEIKQTVIPAKVNKKAFGGISSVTYNPYIWESEDFNYYCDTWFETGDCKGEAVEFANRTTAFNEGTTVYGIADSIYDTMTTSSDSSTFIKGLKHTPNTNIIYIPKSLEGKKTSIGLFAFENTISNFNAIYIPRECISVYSLVVSYNNLSTPIQIMYEGTKEEWTNTYRGYTLTEKVIVRYGCSYPF